MINMVNTMPSIRNTLDQKIAHFLEVIGTGKEIYINLFLKREGGSNWSASRSS